MSELTGRTRPTTHCKAQRGQALIIVLAVMFVLLFIGTIFIAQIARNIQQSGRSVQTQTANALAEAGVRYCDEQLTHTGEGADWRPTPTPPLSLTDPDYQWLAVGFSRVSMNGGRALVRVVYAPDNSDPHLDPRGGLLRIESIGRPGDIGTGNDPTLFAQNGVGSRLRKELVAYKQIGLTDYALYITNKNKTNAEAAIGIPNLGAGSAGAPLSLVLGDPYIGANINTPLPGFPMRVNGDVRFYGSTYLFLSQRGTGDNLLTPDTLLTSGNILFDTNPQDVSRLFVGGNPANQNYDLSKNPTPATNVSDALTGIGGNSPDPQCVANPSSANPACKFDSAGGLIRTGSEQPDVKGYTQNIRSLAPPSLDYYDAGTGFLRYRLLTRETGAFIASELDANGQPTTSRFRQGALGWGTGIYVNNPTDYQAETNTAGVASSYSLRADWLNPKAGFGSQSGWHGPYYQPPGILIELLGDRIRITRDDNESFYLPNGSVSAQNGGKSIEIPLSDYDRLNYTFSDNKTLKDKGIPALLAFSHDGDERDAVLTKSGLKNPYTHNDTYGVNVVLMAEGNVRVRGVYGVDASNVADANPDRDGSTKLERVHLTIVSGRTAYIEGNIVKGDPDKASTCAILAHDYICVNPTVFMAPRQTNAWQNPEQNPDSWINEVGAGTNVPSFDASFSFGLDPKAYGNVAPRLLVRHAAFTTLPTLINLLINPTLALAQTPVNGARPNGNGFYNFENSLFGQDTLNTPNANNFGDAVTGVLYTPQGLPYGTKTPAAGAYGLGFAFPGISSTNLPYLEARSFPLNIDPANPDYLLLTRPGYENLLSFSVDTTTAAQYGPGSLIGTASGTYAFGGAMVTPLDIRIEAVLYAQERSFFVIPGYAFNPDKRDTLQAYLLNGQRPASLNSVTGTISRVAPDFPFYNEPLDVRITLFGSIAENYTASISDQTAWMARWGYVPVYSGAGNLTNNATPPGANNGAPIPDIHKFGTDPNSPAAATADFRTKDEQNAGTSATVTQAGIAHGMRFQYDPSLAFPYAEYVKALNPVAMPNQKPPVGSPVKADSTKFMPLRFMPYTLKDQSGKALPGVATLKLMLPPVPKLPVCPGLLYMGTPSQPLG